MKEVRYSELELISLPNQKKITEELKINLLYSSNRNIDYLSNALDLINKIGFKKSLKEDLMNKEFDFNNANLIHEKFRDIKTQDIIFREIDRL